MCLAFEGIFNFLTCSLRTSGTGAHVIYSTGHVKMARSGRGFSRWTFFFLGWKKIGMGSIMRRKGTVIKYSWMSVQGNANM